MYLNARDSVKFGILVGFLAIFVDAAIAHGLFWDNDPYWTYWITKTFLITTVFTIGTAFFGTGIKQGLIITAVHTLILEIYYQWFAPVGLPQEPEWLDFNHLWTTGVPAHYLAIFSGYLIALWLWRRGRVLRAQDAEGVEVDPRAAALFALGAAVLAIVLDGVITQGLLLRKFPGLTFFIQHLLIGVVFLTFWRVYAGFDTVGWIFGSLMLSLIWTTYSLYLGPQGLPTSPPTYLSYNDLWLKSFPGSFVSALIALWLTSRFLAAPIQRWASGASRRRTTRRASATAAVLLGLLFPSQAQAKEGLPASASSSGKAVMVTGANPVDMSSTQPADGSISIAATEMGNRWSHVQNTDSMNVLAEFTAGGSAYRVRIATPMPRHPHGRYTTWSGVVYRHEMHGGTGIGTPRLPKMKPEISLYGWAEVEKDGALISRMAPAHVMVTTEGPVKGVMLEVDTEDKTLAGVPDGYITVMWPQVNSLLMPESQIRMRMWIGWIVLIGLTVAVWSMVRREERVSA